MKKKAQVLFTSLKGNLKKRKNERKGEDEKADREHSKSNSPEGERPRHQHLMIRPKNSKKSRKKKLPKQLQLGVPIFRHHKEAVLSPYIEKNHLRGPSSWNHRFPEFVDTGEYVDFNRKDEQAREISFLKHEIRNLRNIVRGHSDQITYLLQKVYCEDDRDESLKKVKKYGYRFSLLTGDLDFVYLERHGRRCVKNVFNKRFVNVMIFPLITLSAPSTSSEPGRRPENRIKTQRIAIRFSTTRSSHECTNSVIGFFNPRQVHPKEFEGDSPIFVGQAKFSYGLSFYSGSVYHDKVPEAFIKRGIHSGDVIEFQFSSTGEVSVELNGDHVGIAFIGVVFPIQLCVSIFYAGESFEIL